MSHLARDFARQPPEGSTREADYKVRALAVSLSRSLRVATSSIIAGTGDYRCRRPGAGGHDTHAYTGKSSAVIFSAKESSKIRRCVTGVCCTAPTPFAALRIISDSFDANWNEWGFIRSGRAAHAAVSPRPAQSLYKYPSTCNTVVARAEGCTYAAKVWVWSLFCRPVPNPTRPIATNKSLNAGNQG